MNKQEIQKEALNRATTSASMANYGAIIAGFVEKGISANEILPRENVFTYNAWQALNRQVKKGEKGIKITTWIKIKVKETGAESTRPKSTTVFHISQTKGNDE